MRKDPLSVILRVLVIAAAVVTCFVILFLVGYILVKGVPNISLSLFQWEYTSENVSLVPALINTIIMTLFSLIIAAPLGIFAAIYLTEYARRGNRLVAEPMGQNALMINSSEGFRAAVERALSGEAAEAGLTVLNRHCRLTANPATDGDELKGAVIVLMDVTESHEREKLRREFTANVSHELKTPLTAISGYAEIVANGVAQKEDMPRFAENIYAEARRMITLIGDIIALSELDEEDAALPREPVDLTALAGDAAGKRGISINISGKPEEITGVRQMVDEMLFNLIDNAVKYNVDGGRVDVAVERLGGSALLSVSDTGIGIPKAEQERVFERFYRVDKSRGGDVEGTGLGLSIVKRGALLHNAKVVLESDGSSETTVKVLFPR